MKIDDAAVSQSFLVAVVGEVDISCFAAIDQNDFRVSVFSSKRDSVNSCR